MGRSGPAGSVSAVFVELRLAGTFRVVRDGTELTDGEIGSRKSRTLLKLLKLLAVERPGLVPVERIVEVLWPHERPAAPEQNVATLVSRLRAVLGADLIRGGRAGYRLAAAEAALATGNPRLAAGYAEAAIAADPLDEAAHRWYMSASVAAGEQAKALAARTAGSSPKKNSA